MDVSGAIPPMITPTSDELEVETSRVREFTTFLVQEGVHGLFPVGTTGEFTSLGRDQRRTVIDTIVRNSADLPVLAGCGGTSVRVVREYVDDAADVNADAAVVITPYYLDTTQQGLVRFFEEVAADSPLPIYLYNIPQFTGNGLEPSTVERLAEHPKIVGIKDSSGDFNFFLDLLEETPPSFDVLQGIPTYSIMSLEHGADGLVAGPANVFPHVVRELYEAHERGDHDSAWEQLSNVILPILQSTRSMPMVPALRHLSARAGRDLGRALPPLPDLSAQQRAELDECYETVTAAGLTTIGD